MAKGLKWFLILAVVVEVAFGAGVYLKDDVLKISDSFKTSVQQIQNIDVGKVVSEVSKQVLTATPLNVGGESNDIVFLKSKVIEETNKQRVENGLVALTENKLLYQVAAAKANDMFKNQYFEHTSPSGVDPGTLVSSYGYEYIITGENLILGNFKSEAEMVQDWMNSPGHRANILNTSYTEIGEAVVKGTYEGETVWIAVQEFGLPLSACSGPNEDLKDQIEDSRAQLDSLSQELDEAKTEIEHTDKNISYYNELIDNYNKKVNEYNSLAKSLKLKIANYNNQANFFNECVSSAQSEEG